MLALAGHCAAALAEHDGNVQILLLGDSTIEASVPRRHVPKGPHLEDVIRELLATEKDLPPTNVINLGLSGESHHYPRSCATGRAGRGHRSAGLGPVVLER